jgi:hypothetical protein
VDRPLSPRGTGRLGVGGRGTEARQEHTELGGALAGQQPGHLRDAARPDELAQRRGERRVGQAARAQLHAAADQRQGAARSVAANSPASLDLPPPASAPIRTVAGVPDAAPAKASASSASSDSRPAKTGLTKPLATSP